METLLLDAAALGAVERAVALLAAGELVALPTETVYGLAADAARPEALAAIFGVKERPLFDPLIIHVPTQEALWRYTAPVGASLIALVQRLQDAFWPGALTFVLPRQPGLVHDLVTAGGNLVAIRMSAHPVFDAVLQTLGRPVAAPSANRFGRISPTTGAHVVAELGGRIPLVLDAGPTGHGVESTVVQPSADGASIRILRHGPITAETLAEFAYIESTPPSDQTRLVSPGQTVGHYAPRTPLVFFETQVFAKGPQIGRLVYRRDRFGDADRYGAVEYLSANGDLREAAANLFAALRRLDEAGLEMIVADRAPQEGLGRAITDRLERAAAGSGESAHPTDPKLA